MPPASNTIHWRQVHRRLNADMLFAEDLGGFGCKPVDVEIVDSGVVELRNAEGKKQMPWLGFRGKKKRLGLNATMCKTMQTITGSGYIHEWRGWITLVVVRTSYLDMRTKERCETDAIRIAPTRPRRPDEKSSAAMNDNVQAEPVAANDNEEPGDA